jgi:serine/threonine protein phosphatase 1
LPIKWENDSVFISHAGISYSENYLDENNKEGLLWNKSAIKKINKIQVIGHTPHENKKPIFLPEFDTWNIDTGAYLGKFLSALKLDEKGNFIDFYSVPTSLKDI